MRMTMNKNTMNQNTQHLTADFLQKNREENAYYEKFHACRKSWLRGIIFGIPAAVLFGLLFSGGAIDEVFCYTSIVMTFICTGTLATLFGLRYTEGFGLSGLPLSLIKAGDGVTNFFGGLYVKVWFAWTLIGIKIGLWSLAIMIFSFAFPPESLYYTVRYLIEKNAIRTSMTVRRSVAA